MKKLLSAFCLRHGLVLLAALALVPGARAVLVQYDLVGNAGAGLLPGNQTPVVTGGTGGEIGSGITFDTVSKVLTINVGWGSTNGFTDLTGLATAAHIHGPTLSSAPASYGENAGVLIPLTVIGSTAQGATISQAATLDATQEGYLNNGRLYLNVHTAANGGGEIRGNLVLSPTVLAIDFNDRSFDPVTNTLNGFRSFLIASNVSATAIQTGNVVRAFGTYNVTLSGSGANPGYDDRQRTTPVNGGALTYGQIYRDFVFSPDTATGGLNVTVDGLTPNQAYRVTGWTFDQGTTGGRLVDWSANGTLMVDNYFFNGATLPTTDTQYQWSFKVSASASGQIAITGRRDSSSPAGIAVFLNALKLETTTPDAPTIVAGPTPVDVYAGDNPAFTATIGGTAPFTYQWYKDAVLIAGATNLAFSITNAQSTDAGGYSIVASNSSGTATSAPAALVVRTVTNLNSGLIAYWPLDTLTDVTPDLSGYDQSLWNTNLDAGNLVPGQRGNALYFNGNDEWLTRTNATTNALPAYAYPAYTVAMWVRGYYTNQLDRRVWAESSNTNNNSLMTLGTDSAGTNGNVDVFIRNNNAVTPHNHRKSTFTNAFDGSWHHLAWVDNNGAAKLYVDGVPDATDFSYVRGVLTVNIASLGVVYRTTNSAMFNGSLDDAAVWRRALSQSEVQRAMTNGPLPVPFIVTTTNDSGPGSLRQAVADAAVNPGPDIITFTPALSGQTIKLTNEIVIDDASGVTIDASSLPGGVALSGNNAHRIFTVSSGKTAALQNLTITGGNGAGVADNGVGGAIFNKGMLTLTRCTLSGNSANSGGAIENSGGTLALTHCTLTANTALWYGGAIVNLGGFASAALTHCTLALNQSIGTSPDDGGGAIDNYIGAALTLTGCILAGNTSVTTNGPDLWMEDGTLTASGCLIGNGASSTLTNGVNNNLVGTGAAPLNPLLAPLGNYGGPTKTMALLPGSPARNAAVGSTATSDQRGFPIVGVPDIGAYEAGTFNNFNAFIWESLPTTNVSAHAAGSDYDGDGRLNAVEYAALSDASVSNAGPALVFTPNAAGTVGTNAFAIRAGATDLLYQLARGTTVTNVTNIVVVNPATLTTNTYGPGLTLSSSGTTLTVTDTNLSGNPQLFYQLKAVLTP